MKVVIMAGGKGKRISPLFGEIPKPMIPLQGKPVLEWEIECLRKQGLTDILITVGHLGNKIMTYFGDGSLISPATKKVFGVHIEYYIEARPMGNAGALYEIKDRFTEDFLLINGDILFDVDFKRFILYHRRKKALATLFTHPNNHPFDSGLVVTNADGAVDDWLAKEDKRFGYYRNQANAGLQILSPDILKRRPGTAQVDLDRQILKPLCGTGKLYAYQSPEYVKDMGTPERYYAVCEDIKNDKVHMKNLQNKQKAFFIDRDGTINKYVGYVRGAEEFELIDGVAEAIGMINAAGYLAIVITNQPVIARGEVSIEELREIHNKMETLLGSKGAYIDAIYYCPHHPDKGFDGERPEYKCKCGCRKPEPGLLIKAAEDFRIDLKKSIMIGDEERDMEAGRAAGCESILIGSESAAYPDLYHAVRSILKSEVSGR